MKRNRVLVFAAVLLVLLSGTQTAMGDDTAAYEAQLESLNAKYDELEKQQTALQKEINKAKSEKQRQQAIKNQLDTQIGSVRQQIDLLTEKVDLLEGNISDKQAELEAQEWAIAENYELFKQRMRAMYVTGNASTLEMLLGADSFGEFLSRSQVVSRVAKHDRELLEEMQVELSYIAAIKEEIEENRVEVQSAQEQMAEKKLQLDGQLADAESQIQDMDALEKQYAANKAQIDREMAAAQAEIDEIYRHLESTGEYDGGVMLWPVAGFKTITSYYGWRFNGTDYHTGIDIARLNAAGQGIYGKPILAAADGKVVFAQTSYTPGRGYGIYLILDHGGGISTLYGHASGLAVSAGQTVTRGQTIGYVGSTGWSTGPHLHFEVRVNGSHTDPRPYLGLK